MGVSSNYTIKIQHGNWDHDMGLPNLRQKRQPPKSRQEAFSMIFHRTAYLLDNLKEVGRFINNTFI